VRQKLQQEYMSDHVINIEAVNGDVNKNSKTQNAVIDFENNGGERI
jgi:hypothetical protein